MARFDERPPWDARRYASAFHFLSTALNLKPRNGQLFMLLAGEPRLSVGGWRGYVNLLSFLHSIIVRNSRPHSLGRLRERKTGVRASHSVRTVRASESLNQPLISRFSSRLNRKNPTIHLNYCIGLYNAGERAAAAKQRSLFERKFASDDSNDVDPEVFVRRGLYCVMCYMGISKVLATSASIGPSLHVGEGLVWKDGGTENGETERNKKAESNVRKSEAMTDGE